MSEEVDLDAIEVRLAGASPGPWEIIPPMVQNEAGQYSPAYVSGPSDYGYEDVEFIAHSRQDMEDMAKELRVLRAQVASFGKVQPGASNPPRDQPDDTEDNEAIDEAEDWLEAADSVGVKWGVPMTNNSPRWQDGVYLRHMGEWIADIRKVIERYKKDTHE